MDERDVLAELAPVLVYEPLAVRGLLALQLQEHCGRRWKALVQTFGKVAVDAPVLLLQGNG